VLGGTGHHVSHDRVAGPPAVAVAEGCVRAAWCDDEWRVGDEEVDGLGKGVVEGSGTELDAVSDAGQPHREPRDVEGPLGQVRCDDLLRMPREQHGLDAASRADVRGEVHVSPWSDVQQRASGAAVAQDVLALERVGAGESAVVRDQKQCVVARHDPPRNAHRQGMAGES
jgi:hypothetical protein